MVYPETPCVSSGLISYNTEEMIVTFLYRIHHQNYYGKYIGAVSDDYEEGLDIEIQDIIFPIIQPYYSLHDISQVSIGILFADRNVHDYYSEQEKKVFDLLYCKWSNQPVEIFLRGALVKKIEK